MGKQVLGQLVATLVTIGRFLGNHLRQDPGDLLVDLAIQLAHVGNLGAHDFQHQPERRFIGERHASGKHLEEHDAERENVRALIDLVTETDFRRQVAGGADELAGRGQLLRHVLVGQGNAEIGDLDRTAA